MSRPTDPSADTTQGVFELQEHRDPLFDSIASRNRALLDFRSLGPLDLVQTLRVNRDPGSCGLKHQDDHPVTNIPVSQQPIGLRQHKKTWHAVVGCCSCSSAGGTEADFPAAGTAGGTTGETAVWEGYLKPYLLAQEKPNVMQSIGAAVGLRNHWWVERVIFCMWNALEKTDLRVVYEDGMIASYGLRVPVSPPMEAEGAGTGVNRWRGGRSRCRQTVCAGRSGPPRPWCRRSGPGVPRRVRGAARMWRVWVLSGAGLGAGGWGSATEVRQRLRERPTNAGDARAAATLEAVAGKLRFGGLRIQI